MPLPPHFDEVLRGKVKAWSSVSQLILPPRTSAEGAFSLLVPITLEGKLDHLSKERNPVWKGENSGTTARRDVSFQSNFHSVVQ